VGFDEKLRKGQKIVGQKGTTAFKSGFGWGKPGGGGTEGGREGMFFDEEALTWRGAEKNPGISRLKASNGKGV